MPWFQGILRICATVCLLITCVYPGLRSGEKGLNESQSGVPHFKGTDYEIGYQRGRHMLSDIRRWENSAGSLFRGPQGPALQLALEFRWTDLGERFPGLLQEWRGMAKAAGAQLEAVAFGMIGELQIRTIAGLPVPPQVERRGDHRGCSAFGITHSDRGPILGKTSDSHGEPSSSRVYTDDDVLIIDYDDGFRLLMCGFAILNDQGLAVGDANAHYDGVTGVGDGRADDLAPIIARYCPDVDSAVAFIRNYRITDEGRHFCLVDSSGRAAVVEMAPGGLVNVRWGDSTGYVYVTNTSPDSVMKVHDTNDSAYVANSDYRLANFERMFSDTAFRFTFDDAESIIFSHDTLGAICQHGDSIEGQWHTTRSRLVLPAEEKYYLAARATPGLSYHPCDHAWREYQFIAAVAIESVPPTALPEPPTLMQNYPNPFNSQTTITYLLKEEAQVELAVYNLLGEKIRTIRREFQSRGQYSPVWNGENDAGQSVASGVYYYRLRANDEVLTKRLVFMK